MVVGVLALGLLSGCAVTGAAGVFTAHKSAAADAKARVELMDAVNTAMTYLVENPNVSTMTVADLTLLPAESAIVLHFSSAERFCFDTTSESGTVLKGTLEGSAEGACVEGVDY